jgi:fatty-acyl-CoA synthase
MQFVERVKADFECLRGFFRVLRELRPIAKYPARVFASLIDELAARHGERPALLSEHESFSYAMLADRVNRYARWALAQGLGKGEAVCLLMPNRPEYLAIWLGITRVGGVVALVNTNLVGQSLAACIDGVAPKHIIVAAGLSLQLAGAEPYMKTNPRLWIHGERTSRIPCIDEHIDVLSGAPLNADERREVTIHDTALYIYTAGIDGPPKPAAVDHHRLMQAICAFAGILDAKPDDRLYDCLPMYHLLGGVVAIGPLLVRGASIAIREKFSAREFWHDIRRTECTILLYVGEFPRALVHGPPHRLEKQHRLRLCCGTGMRPEIWRRFKARFAIPHILEFYGSTAGNVTLVNFEEKEGSVGRLPWPVRRRFPTAVIRFDAEKEAPMRDSRGHCLRCRPNEVGEVIGRIVDGSAPAGGGIAGTAGATDDESRVLHNVFKRGDSWLRTGDLMYQDPAGHFYFVDRVGDTYRWKGENVSTTEVALALRAFPGVDDAIVYGVRVPNRDGRVGMATVICAGWIDVAELHAHLAAHLPGYARPLFLRVHRRVADQLKKSDLAAEGFDPARTADQLFFSDAQSKAFVPLDEKLHAGILAGEARL